MLSGGKGPVVLPSPFIPPCTVAKKNQMVPCTAFWRFMATYIYIIWQVIVRHFTLLKKKKFEIQFFFTKGFLIRRYFLTQ
jgi:hypothetical protein